MKKAIVLFSGGLDSTTCLAIAKSEGYDCTALSFNYNQRHAAELNAAKKIAQSFGVKHLIIDIPHAQFSGSALVDRNLAIPNFIDNGEIPITYVPARNTIFLSFALAVAEVQNAKNIFIGVSSVDYSGYPDCRPEYLEAFEKMANLATKIGVQDKNIKIHAPLIYLSKAKTIQLGNKLGVDYRSTVSCYSANSEGLACGRCDSCCLRKKGFAEAFISDPTLYENL